MFDWLERKRIARETEAKIVCGELWEDMTQDVDLSNVIIRRVGRSRDINRASVELVTYQPLWFKVRSLWRRMRLG